MTAVPILSEVEARVLGSLIEKSTTTPEQYPLSLNALTNACNQKSNRAPHMHLETDELRKAITGLREQQLVVEIWPSGGGRTEKYRHSAETTLGLDPAELAVLAELLLRRAQMPGELRSRASRMTNIADLEALRSILAALETRGYVRSVAPLPGSHTTRYDHCLCGDQGSPLEAPMVESPVPQPSGRDTAPSQSTGIEARVEALEARVRDLEEKLSRGSL